MLATLGLAILAFVLLVVVYVMWSHTYWTRRGGVIKLRNFFLFGGLGDAFLGRKFIADCTKDLYDETRRRGHKFGGSYVFTVPSIVIADPELMREIAVKHFDSFTDRVPFAESNVETILARSLLNLRGKEWRTMRHALSPSFTGSKLRGMMELMVYTGREFARFLQNRPNPDEPLDMREAFRRFSADVIATTAYGTLSNSVNDPSSEFYAKGMKIMEPTGFRRFVLAGYVLSPKLMQKLRIKFLPEDLRNFFSDIISKNIKFRESEKMTRPDMIQLLLDQRRNNKPATDSAGGAAVLNGLMNVNGSVHGKTQTAAITDDDIVSQALTFFFGGFDTSAGAMCFATHLLAMHPDVQQRLRAEVDAAIIKDDGRLSFDTINELKYMDMVLAEVLRMYPVVAAMNRVCTQAINLPEFGLNVQKGDVFLLPFYAFHRDPEFFPDPDRFDPERFSEENKSKIKSFTYLPFGAGPRNCIGMRFAQLEVKLVLAYTLASCELHVSARTKLPIKLDPKAITMVPEGGFYITVTPRTNPSIQL